ncbi:ferredoxin reductase family protein [Aliamphritea ceti]|uniref:ferredoxin reductase family protein n=1 Tax=Aliamphritea ceti TaxID=1524258 RepID=UPI0021C4725F|nr:ferric reductase-like transmembrane domain-containing protein [Aliamphritea ceti]
MRIVGVLLVLIAVFFPLYSFIPLFGKYDTGALFSQYIGIAALVLMGISQLLATRMRWLEWVFGGLDRIYVLHKWIGIAAMAAVLIHDTVDAEIDGLGQETWLVDLAETLGELSLYGLLILVVISIATFVPYHLWRKTHKFMGAMFVCGAFHYVFMLKPFELQSLLGMYALGFCVLGILCYLYTLMPFTWMTGRYAYQVVNREVQGSALALTLKQEGRAVKHQSGQFAFLSFADQQLDEPHPFTISQAPDQQGNLRFTVKALGDYTRQLKRKAEPGMRVYVSNAYGHFRRVPDVQAEVWIAAGIGITPFLAWAQDKKCSTPVELFYCVRELNEAAHLEELQSIVDKRPELSLHLIETSVRGRLSADDICGSLQASLDEVRVYYCGPKPMRESLLQQLGARGLRNSRFHYEVFELRSGIGLRKLAAWGTKHWQAYQAR